MSKILDKPSVLLNTLNHHSHTNKTYYYYYCLQSQSHFEMLDQRYQKHLYRTLVLKHFLHWYKRDFNNSLLHIRYKKSYRSYSLRSTSPFSINILTFMCSYYKLHPRGLFHSVLEVDLPTFYSV